MTQTKRSAGLLLFRRGAAGGAIESIEVLLVHPGGPFWKNKDTHAWSIPKGELTPGETALAAARREFEEERGFALDRPDRDFAALEAVGQSGGKTVHAFALEADCDAAMARSNTFTLEWPPKSGKMQVFPEIDRAAWFALDVAAEKIHRGQEPLLAQLRAIITTAGTGSPLAKVSRSIEEPEL